MLELQPRGPALVYSPKEGAILRKSTPAVLIAILVALVGCGGCGHALAPGPWAFLQLILATAVATFIVKLIAAVLLLPAFGLLLVLGDYEARVLRRVRRFRRVKNVVMTAAVVSLGTAFVGGLSGCALAGFATLLSRLCGGLTPWVADGIFGLATIGALYTKALWAGRDETGGLVWYCYSFFTAGCIGCYIWAVAASATLIGPWRWSYTVLAGRC